MGGGGSKCMFPYKNGKPFNGIFDYLTKAYGGNPQTTGHVEVSSSGTSVRSVSKIEDVISERNTGEWASNNESNSWIEFNFKDHKLLLTAYTIQTFGGDVGNMHMKSWKLESSEDGYNWTMLDQVSECNEINRPNAILTRPITMTGSKNIFRITMTDKNYFGTYTMCLKRIEFFGNIS